MISLATNAGFGDSKTRLCVKVTYGDVLHDRFGLQASDWQGTACNDSREQFVQNLLDGLRLDVKAAFELDAQ